MLILTTRPGWKIKFSPSTSPMAQQSSRIIYNERQADELAENYRAALLPGETVEVIPVNAPVELKVQIHSALTVVRAVAGEEFADQLSQILADYGEECFQNGVDFQQMSEVSSR